MSRSPKSLPFLPDLMRFIDAACVEETGQPAREKAAYECLKGFLRTTAELLHSIRREWSLRELLVHILRHLPVKASEEEPLADLVHVVKESKSAWRYRRTGRSFDVLDQSCDWLAQEIGMAWAGLSRDDLVEVLRKLAPPVEEKPLKEGPTEMGVFLWRKHPYSFSPRQWRLLRVLWGKSRVEEDVVRSEVYQDKKTAPNALWQLQVRTQDKLNAYRLPFEIVRPDWLYLRLKRRRSLTAS